MNNLDKQYTDLLQDILDNGVAKQDRTGTGTISVFGRQIRHKMSDGFPLLTTKKMAWKTMVTELLWFLRGDTNIKFLVDNNCHIWDGDAYKAYWNVVTFEKPDYFHEKHGHLKMSVKKEDDNYLPLTQEEFINRIKTDDKFTHWGDLGKIYGHQWRNWGYDSDKWSEEYKKLQFGSKEEIEHLGKKSIDQIANLINDLKTNPDSRRLMVNAWNVGELDSMVLPPCHYGFQFYTRELNIKERVKLANENNYNNSKIRFGINPDDADENDFELIRVLNIRGVPKRAISLMYNARSQDVPLGTPFNISSYGLLLEIIGKIVNMVPDELIANMGDCHIYLNQIDGIKEQLTREPYPLATLKHLKTDDFYKSLSEDLSLLTHLDSTDFIIENYQSHPAIKMPLSN
jgi:thymidylate synthase